MTGRGASDRRERTVVVGSTRGTHAVQRMRMEGDAVVGHTGRRTYEDLGDALTGLRSWVGSVLEDDLASTRFHLYELGKGRDLTPVMTVWWDSFTETWVRRGEFRW